MCPAWAKDQTEDEQRSYILGTLAILGPFISTELTTDNRQIFQTFLTFTPVVHFPQPNHTMGDLNVLVLKWNFKTTQERMTFEVVLKMLNGDLGNEGSHLDHDLLCQTELSFFLL